jgi:hypothetical protein
MGESESEANGQEKNMLSGVVDGHQMEEGLRLFTRAGREGTRHSPVHLASDLLILGMRMPQLLISTFHRAGEDH